MDATDTTQRRSRRIRRGEVHKILLVETEPTSCVDRGVLRQLFPCAVLHIATALPVAYAMLWGVKPNLVVIEGQLAAAPAAELIAECSRCVPQAAVVAGSASLLP